MLNRFEPKRNTGEGAWAEERLRFEFTPGFFDNFERYMIGSGRIATLDQVRQGDLTPTQAIELISEIVKEQFTASQSLSEDDERGLLAESDVLEKLIDRLNEYTAFAAWEKPKWVEETISFIGLFGDLVSGAGKDIKNEVLKPLEDREDDGSLSAEAWAKYRSDVVLPIRKELLALEAIAHGLSYESGRIIDMWRFKYEDPGDAATLAKRLNRDSPFIMKSGKQLFEAKKRIAKILEGMEVK